MESDPPFVREIDAKAAKGDAACKTASSCLQAMRSVIGANGILGSAATYFAATVAALQRQLAQKGGMDEGPNKDTSLALLMLLRRSLAAVSPAVANSRLNDVALALSPVFRATSDEVITRQALICLTLAADASYRAGGRPNRKVLKPVFALLTDQRTSVRRQAEFAAAAILKTASSAPDPQTMEFAAQHLAQMVESARPGSKGAEDIPAQRAISLLRAVGPLLPAESLSSIFAALARLPTVLGQHPCCTAGFEFLGEHFAPAEEEDDEDEESMKTEQEDDGKLAQAVKLLPGLLETKVSMLNVAYVSAFAKALAGCTATLCSEKAPKEVGGQKLAAVKKLLALFAERDPSLLRAAREACIVVLSSAGNFGDSAILEELPEIFRPLLRFEAKGSWPQALPVVASLLDSLGELRVQRSPSEIPTWTLACFERAKPLVLELVQARDKARAAELHVFGKELGQCLASAVATFGPQLVLQVAPLQLLQYPLSDPSYETHSRSWLLWELKDACKRTSLSFFSTAFLSLAASLKAKAAEAEAANSQVISKKYLQLLEQVWALLPGFFDEPLDLNVALMANGGQLAKQLVGVLQNEASLRDSVWASFKRCCDAAHEPPSTLSEALQESNVACLRVLSSRVMPEMFNAYVKIYTENEGQDASRVSHSRQLALGAVSSFAQVCEPVFVGSLFKTLVAKWLKATTGEAPPTEAPALGDLANTLVPHLPAELLELALKVFGPALKSATPNSGSEEEKLLAANVQKAAYRAICNVIRHPAAATGGLGDAAKVISLWSALKDARQTCVPSALKARLLAIQALLNLLETSLGPHFKDPSVKQEYLQCLTTVMPEVLFHLRDQSSHVRDAARECLHLAATTAIHQELQTEIVTLLSAGLAGLSRHSKAAALDALSRLMYEHHSKMAAPLRSRLIGVVLMLLEDRDAQVWRAAVKFCKVVVFVLSKESLVDFLPQIMRLFSSRNLASAKMLVRGIVERLVKVLPEETLEETFPKAHILLLHHVQKQMKRQQRPKTVREAKAGEEEAGEEAEEEEMGGKRRGKKDKKQPESWEAFKAGDDPEVEGDGDMDMDHLEDTAKEARKRSRVLDDGGAFKAGAAAAAAKDAKEGGKRSREPPTSAVMQHDAVQALLDAWEDESDSDDGMDSKGRKSARGKRKRDAGQASTWIQEDQDVPIDFMSADAAHSVLTVRAPPSKRQKGTQIGNAGAESKVEALRRSGLRFSADGRLVVDEDKEEAAGKGGGFTLGTETKKISPLQQLAAKRLARAKAKAKARVDRRGAHLIKGLDSFKPGKKKSQGDAKRKGSKLEPFAYVRLNPKVTKEKYKGKATDSFAKVIRGAKKGVLKGAKARKADGKKREFAETRKKKQAKGKTRRTGSR